MQQYNVIIYGRLKTKYYTGCTKNGVLTVHYGIEEITVNVRKMLKKWADVNSSDFNPQTCKLLRRINPSLSGMWQIAPGVCSVPERINPSVGAYYFDTRVGMYLFFLS
jgi:hypothetical protein